jgi:hypothetical protein
VRLLAGAARLWHHVGSNECSVPPLAPPAP